MNSTVITLSQPIMHGQTEITELELRPIIGKDMIGLRFEISQRDNGVGLIIDADAAFKLAYKLTGIPACVLAQMAAPYAAALTLELQSFLLSGRWTGKD